MLDDIIVWWIDDESFHVMPNASNTERVVEALGGGARDLTEERTLLAFQGPDARSLLAAIAPEAAEVGRFHVAPFEWRGAACIVAGTGYTGEDGVEVAIPNDRAAELWDAAAGRWLPARRTRRTGHAAPRGGAPAARPRARAGHHPAPGRAGLGGELDEGAVPRVRGTRTGA